MKNKLQYLLTLATILFLAACGESGSGLLEETAGVWRAQRDGTMVSIIYSDKKLSMLIGDTPIPVSLGDIDNNNKTINLNITQNDGKLAIWTLKQIWDKDLKSFHLSFTLNDGTQDELSFVRKISTDDLNKLANAEARNKSASIQDAAKSVTISEAPVAEVTDNSPEPVVPPAPPSSHEAVFSPSFDCLKASNFAETAICNDPLLGKLDGALSENYKQVLAANIGDNNISHLKSTQIAWIKERDECTTNQCLTDIYRKRVDEVCDYTVITGVFPPCTASEEVI